MLYARSPVHFPIRSKLCPLPRAQGVVDPRPRRKKANGSEDDGYAGGRVSHGVQSVPSPPGNDRVLRSPAATALRLAGGSGARRRMRRYPVPFRSRSGTRDDRVSDPGRRRVLDTSRSWRVNDESSGGALEERSFGAGTPSPPSPLPFHPQSHGMLWSPAREHPRPRSPPPRVPASPATQVMDHDVYTSNDAIGLVYVDLSPLLMRTAEQEQDSGRDLVVQGWFPLYDTLQGVRGALCLVIKVSSGSRAKAWMRAGGGNEPSVTGCAAGVEVEPGRPVNRPGPDLSLSRHAGCML